MTREPPPAFRPQTHLITYMEHYGSPYRETWWTRLRKKLLEHVER